MTTQQGPTRELFPMRLFSNRPPFQTAAQKLGVIMEPVNEPATPAAPEPVDFRAKPVKVDDEIPVTVKVGDAPGPKEVASSAIDSASHSGTDDSASGKTGTPMQVETPTTTPPSLQTSPSESPEPPVVAAKDHLLQTQQRPMVGASLPPVVTTGVSPAESPASS